MLELVREGLGLGLKFNSAICYLLQIHKIYFAIRRFRIGTSRKLQSTKGEIEEFDY